MMRTDLVGGETRQVLPCRQVPGPWPDGRIGNAERRQPARFEGYADCGRIFDGEAAASVAGNRLHGGNLTEEVPEQIDLVDQIDQQRPTGTGLLPPQGIEITWILGE